MVVTVVASAIALYLVYRLRTPISWLLFAIFVAVAVSAPVNLLSRRMPRGAAIAVVYFGLILIPLGISAILVPPAVAGTSDLVSDFPAYVDDLNATVQESETLRNLNENFDLVSKLEDLANDAAGSLGRRRRHARRPRRRPARLALRAVHDPRDEHFHRRARPRLDAGHPRHPHDRRRRRRSAARSIGWPSPSPATSAAPSPNR